MGTVGMASVDQSEVGHAYDLRMPSYQTREHRADLRPGVPARERARRARSKLRQVADLPAGAVPGNRGAQDSERDAVDRNRDGEDLGAPQ